MFLRLCGGVVKHSTVAFWMLLPQYLVRLIRSDKACFDIPLYDRDFYLNTKAFHVAEIFSIFIRRTFIFITSHFRAFTYLLIFSVIIISFRSFVRPIFKILLTFTLPLKQCRQISEYNIKMNLQEVGWWGVEWISLAQDRARRPCLVNAVMNLWVT
jgi:hypothetical protein